MRRLTQCVHVMIRFKTGVAISFSGQPECRRPMEFVPQNPCHFAFAGFSCQLHDTPMQGFGSFGIMTIRPIGKTIDSGEGHECLHGEGMDQDITPSFCINPTRFVHVFQVVLNVWLQEPRNICNKEVIINCQIFTTTGFRKLEYRTFLLLVDMVYTTTPLYD